MATVRGSYKSVVLGISEQTPQDRREGQHFEQVNMISDPVRGLARRHGSVLLDSQDITPTNPMSQAVADTSIADLQQYREVSFFVAGVEYCLLYRKEKQPASAAPALIVFDKDNKKFIPVVRPATDALLDTLYSGGVSAAVNVGKYLFLAGNDIVPKYSVNDKFGGNNNQKYHAIWVRGGAYSRKFEAQVALTDGRIITASYTTMASSYPHILDTSDIPFDDPNYNQKVSQRTTKYNSEVNKWIGDAAADIQPGNIAEKLAVNIRTVLGLDGSTVQVIGSHICIGPVPTIKSVIALDDGDGQLIRAVSNEVKSPDEVSQIHWAGKVVKIRPKKNAGDDAYYMEAVPKDKSITGFTEVTWRESAGYIMTPEDVFMLATVIDGKFYIASTATLLKSITNQDHPEFKPNAVGDDISSPPPYFFGRRITCMFMFQDRLVIASEAVTFMSRPGDYFNWFRASVLTVDDADPIEMFAKGAEDDTLRVATTYDRNTLLFGDRHQYVLNGRQPMTPKNSSIVVLSAYEDAVDADPINSGNYVFYAKTRNNVASVHQVQMGQLVDSPESFEVSQQLDRYLRGVPVQLVALTAPNFVFLRTSALADGVYIYQYIDTPAGTERLFDSWSRWTWHPSLGKVCGMSPHDGDLIIFTVRMSGSKMYVVADKFFRDTAISQRPYLDSAFRYTDVIPDTKWQGDLVNAAVAFDEGSEFFMIGHDADKAPEIEQQYPTDLKYLWAGLPYQSYVVPTNPYVRDRNENAIVTGRLTLSKFTVSVADTGGMIGAVKREYVGAQWETVTKFTGRVLNQPANRVGRQPIVTTQITVPVMRESREVKYSLSSWRWLPLTITAIEWQGQHFNNARRV